MTPSQIQIFAVKKRREEEDKKFPTPKVSEEEYFYPFQYPCPFLKGYFYIPWTDSKIVINKNGNIFNLLKGKEHKKHYNHKGYEMTTLRFGNIFKALPVHRIVASIFVPKPERHRDKFLKDLEVNHKDGNKNNNHFSNLEWVTTNENMLHAWSSGLVKTEKPVLEKDVHTGEIKRYPSISECARQNCFDPSSLCVHLNSLWAGILQVNYHVFKFDDGSPWPDDISVPYNSSKIGIHCDCVAENILTKKRLIFCSLKDACLTLGLNQTLVKLHRSRKGLDTPYQFWIFYPLFGKSLSKKFKGQN